MMITLTESVTLDALTKMSDALKLLTEEAEKFNTGMQEFAKWAESMRAEDMKRLTTPGHMAYWVAHWFIPYHFELMAWLEDCPGALR